MYEPTDRDVGTGAYGDHVSPELVGNPLPSRKSVGRSVFVDPHLFKPERQWQEEGFSPAELRTTEREKTGVRKQQTGEAVQSNLLMRESLSQLPQARLVAVFKLVLCMTFEWSH